MKVAILGTAHPYRGGLAAYNERLALEYQNMGHDVTLYTFTLQYPSIFFPGETQYSEEESSGKLDIVPCLNSVNPFNWISTGLRIRKEKPDLLIVKYWLPFMGPSFGTVLRIVKSNNHTRVITIVDNMIPHEHRVGDKIFTKYFVPTVDGFVAMSEKVLDDIKLFDTQKPKTLSPHPIFDNFGELLSREEALNTLGLDPDYQYMLFFGLVRKYKGLDLLIEAFADERFRNSKIKLIIAGEYYSDKEMYLEMINTYKLQDNIIQVDRFIQDSEVKLYFSAADLVVQPYKSATQSGVTQIAYHFNTPMVVTDVGGLAELCPHEKVGYVCATDPKNLADAILRFFDQTEKEQMVLNIIEEKKKYAWSILADNILNMLKEIKAEKHA